MQPLLWKRLNPWQFSLVAKPLRHTPKRALLNLGDRAWRFCRTGSFRTIKISITKMNYTWNWCAYCRLPEPACNLTRCQCILTIRYDRILNLVHFSDQTWSIQIWSIFCERIPSMLPYRYHHSDGMGRRIHGRTWISSPKIQAQILATWILTRMGTVQTPDASTTCLLVCSRDFMSLDGERWGIGASISFRMYQPLMYIMTLFECTEAS